VTTPEVLVLRDAQQLADAIAARLVTAVVEAQADGRPAHVCLTGGHIGIGCLASLNASPSRDAIDWGALHVWWGDDRYVASEDPDRNDAQAGGALLDHVPLDPAKVHRMPSTDSGLDVDAAAAVYARELKAAARSEDHAALPSFDVCLLGLGPDAHVASLFPQMPGIHETTRTVVGVHGSPKPPPQRISLTLPALTASREIWLVVAGGDKADAVRLALSDAGPVQVPGAGARGRDRTIALLDEAAASALPPDLRRLASP
jgi:6-phosphogluconolactonase